tara:strand:- start:3865 stop:4443 length:579 start_codon:yes stop_codon:yes gene_type:complete
MSSFDTDNSRRPVDYFELNMFLTKPSDMSEEYFQERWKPTYKTYVEEHNAKQFKLATTSGYFDSGFDLLNPESKRVKVGYPLKYRLGAHCSSSVVSGETKKPCGYMLVPRSSISKTSLRLANSIGIIDSGYRGELMAVFDCFYKDYNIDASTRLVQVVPPRLDLPVFVNIVDSLEDLGSTERAHGGFGSTGR